MSSHESPRFPMVPMVQYDRHPAFAGLGLEPSSLPGDIQSRLQDTEAQLAALDSQTDPDPSKRTASASKGELLQQLKLLLAGSEELVTDLVDAVVRSRNDWDDWERDVLSKYGVRLHSEYARHLRNVERRAKHLHADAQPSQDARLEALRTRGAVAAPMSDERKREILDRASPFVARLRATDVKNPNGFSSTTIPPTSRRLWTTVRSAVAPLELDQLAESYLGYPAQLTHIELHVNRPGNRYFSDRYSDFGMPAAKSAGMHFDSGCGMLKAMVYLSDVTPRSGPFSYIETSNTWVLPYFTRFSGQAFPYTGVALDDVRSRKLFMKMPPVLRQISHFGADFSEVDESAEQEMLGHERTFTSQDGDVVVFDNRGLHRGGVLPQEERIALQLQYSPRALLEKAAEKANHSIRQIKTRIPALASARVR